jgi:hypothetical protein
MNHGAVACMNIDRPRSVSGVHIQSTVQISPGVVLWDDRAGSARLIDSLSRLDFPRTGISVTPGGVVGRRSAADSVHSIPVRKPRD